MKLKLIFLVLAITLCPKYSMAGISSLESLIRVPVPTKYDRAVNSAKDAALKQSGLSDLYRASIRQASQQYRKKALLFIEEVTGVDQEISVGVVGVASSVIVSKSLYLNVTDAFGTKYQISIRQGSIATGLQFKF
jgi:hypothetical protein